MRIHAALLTVLFGSSVILSFLSCGNDDAITLDSELSTEQSPTVTPNTDSATQPVRQQECCSDPGAISQCWWQDADQDGVMCRQSSDCPNGTSCIKNGLPGTASPDGAGLCECSGPDDCAPNGVCIIEAGNTKGLCGPSYCNGFKH